MVSVNAQNRIEYSFLVGPLVSSSVLSQTKSNITSNLPTNIYINSRQQIDKSKIGFIIETNIGYHIAPRYTLCAGFMYLNQQLVQGKYFVNNRYLISDYLVIQYEVQKFNVTYKYLGLPLGIKYKITNTNKIGLGFGASISPLYLVNTNNSDETLYNYFEPTVNNKCVINGNISTYLGFKIHNKIELVFTPSFGYSLTPNIIELSSVKQRNYFFAISTSIVFNNN